MTGITNVLAFPGKEVSDWTIIERSITEYCSANMFPPEAEKRIKGVMKAFWEMLDPGLNYSIDIGIPSYVTAEDAARIRENVATDVSRLNGEILQRFTKRLYIERFAREVDFMRDIGLIP